MPIHHVYRPQGSIWKTSSSNYMQCMDSIGRRIHPKSYHFWTCLCFEFPHIPLKVDFKQKFHMFKPKTDLWAWNSKALSVDHNSEDSKNTQTWKWQMCGKFIFDKKKMWDRTLHLQAHTVLDMSLILSMMCLTPFSVHGLKVLSGVCLAALLSVLFISFSCQ